MFSALPCNSVAWLRDTEYEPIQRDVHSGTTSVHRCSATFSDDIGRGRALMGSAALSESIRDFSVHLCSGLRAANPTNARGNRISRAARVIEFLDPLLSVFSRPLRRGRARVGVKAGGVPRLCFSHPSQPWRDCVGTGPSGPAPARREGVEGPGRRGKIEN